MFKHRQNPSEQITRQLTRVLRIVLIAGAAWALCSENWSVLFISVLTLVLGYVPGMMASRIKIRVPLQFEFIITLFLYASLFLGETRGYYEKFPWWDTVLHTGSAFAFGFIGFLVLFMLYVSNKIAARPFVIAFFSFTFAVALGALWEIFEFGMDQAFSLNMQRSGLHDTMWDLIVDTIGAGTASIIGYIYLKFKVWDPFDTFINWFIAANPRFKLRKWR